MIANSGHDENGCYSGGKAGDQTGTEWRLQEWYRYPYGGWDYVIRHPKESVRKKIAELAKKAAKNDKIGYDQSQRTTFWLQLKAANYDPAKIKAKCEADCSAGVAAIVKAVGYKLNIKALKDVPTTMWTGNERRVLIDAGFKVLKANYYLNSDSYLLEGDILLNEKNHTCINVTTGSKAISANVPYPTAYLYKGVNEAYEVMKLQKCLNKIMKTGLEVDGIFGELTLKAVKKFQKKYKLEADGLVGPKTRAAIKKAVM